MSEETKLVQLHTCVRLTELKLRPATLKGFRVSVQDLAKSSKKLPSTTVFRSLALHVGTLWQK